MIINKKNALTGSDNKRLNTDAATNRENTAAWQNKEQEYRVDEVNKPSIESVIDAKDWVDNGSRL